MYTAVRIVKMKAWSPATRTSKPVRATSSENGTAAPIYVDAKSAVESTAKLDSSKWPASMLAKSRTDSESGRTNRVETSSIGVTRMYSATGTPGGNNIVLK